METEDNTWLFKVLIPTLAGIAMKLAVMATKGKVTWINAGVSIVTGVATTYLLGDIIYKNTSPEYAIILIAVVAILSEKIAYWIIYKFRVDSMLETVVEVVVEKLKARK